MIDGPCLIYLYCFKAGFRLALIKPKPQQCVAWSSKRLGKRVKHNLASVYCISFLGSSDTKWGRTWTWKYPFLVKAGITIQVKWFLVSVFCSWTIIWNFAVSALSSRVNLGRIGKRRSFILQHIKMQRYTSTRKQRCLEAVSRYRLNDIPVQSPQPKTVPKFSIVLFIYFNVGVLKGDFNWLVLGITLKREIRMVFISNLNRMSAFRKIHNLAAKCKRNFWIHWLQIPSRFY